jgi:hypothetical protein
MGLLLIAALTACGDDDANPDASSTDDANTSPDATVSFDAIPMPDAGPTSDLSCLSTASPTTAPDPLTLDGALFDVSETNEITPLVDVTLELRSRADDDLIDTATTDANGDFSFELVTGGEPVDAYFYADTDEHRPMRAYPPYALADTEGMLLFLVTDDVVATWYEQAGATEQANTGTVVAYATDCQRDGLPGATIELDQATDVIYYDDDPQQWDPTLTATVNGYALGINATPGPLAITPTIGDTPLPTDTANAVAGELTLTVTMPYD